MADRSTAAVGVADEGGEAPPAAREDDATPDGTTTDDQESGTAGDGNPPKDTAEGTEKTEDGAEETAQAPAVDADPQPAQAEPDPDPQPDPEPSPRPAPRAKPKTSAPDLHSGHRLARRYQLAECVTRVDGFSSWRAVDEKLRRAVGIHLLPAEHPRSRQVLAAARSAALLGDPRFVQVLDAVEEGELAYVIHEWLPDALSLTDLLASGPLEPHEAYQMASQVSQGMAAAHREGLAHLRLDPGAVLRTSSGQYRIRGLAVAASLRGLSSDRPQRQDTEAIGALLYAALTQRWPYEEDAHGLSGLPKGVGLVAPDQLRAGVHRGMSDVAMRALVNDGATASREVPPCTTPEELAKAIAGIPRIRPPEHPAPVYQPPAFQQPPQPPTGATRYTVAGPSALPTAPPPALPGRTGSALKWAVSALLIVAIGLGSWQLADAMKSRENHSPRKPPSSPSANQNPAPPPSTPLTIVGVKDFDPPPKGNGSETPSQIGRVDDHDPNTTWETSWYSNAGFGDLKDGVGVILDLGSAHRVSSVAVNVVGDTDLELWAAPQGTTTRPTTLDGFQKAAGGSGDQKVTLKPSGQVTSRYLLVWLTKLPVDSDGTFRGRISEISVTG
ncbi:protein kinase family protein [Streptomyces cocklensis]|uniref:Protein kinase domain-containing protein n=1 Tax=Actinacidiphila cocklensis TaxID=887465 RepID=A0A9W4DP59_9ACTN|nr:protein kinase family protein [Actinacidiphila cocklensis]MDD1056988.1 protein kinase family protein [Actinacidiphila cocklensis]WSX78140.1 protein kinase family protein [Streptomyces sp. NBC_00899]CAG6393509.1 Protein kinase domain-containing protein [Actinacidiphila cocklensis]